MIDTKSLVALAAVLRHGSFEAAANELSVTPSAISQRVKNLEEQLGAVLIQRGHPCTATEVGARLHRHSEEIALLETALAKDLDLPNASPTPPHIKIATNADSLASWLMPALAASGDVMFELISDDQEHSAEWLRRGEVQAAITSHSTAIHGSDCTPLGSLLYIASASPEFVSHWFPDGITDEAIRTAPALLFSHKDRLQKEWVHRQLGHNITTQNHKIPSARGFVDAALLGMGWGMHPDVLIKDHLAEGRLVELVPDTPLDVALFWQVNRRVALALAPLTKAIKAAAGDVLRQT